MSYKFTCITCKVAFIEAEIQRQHYKTDWHRYNLKRKVVELPPVTAEDFQKRVLQQREKDKAEAEAKDLKINCKICKKSFSTEKAFENHLNSKKHIGMLSQTTTSETDSDSSTNHVVYVKNTEEQPNLTLKNKMQIEDESGDECDMEVEEVDSDEWEEEYSENNPILKHNCLFCSNHSAKMIKNLKHMTLAHSFFIPDIEYLIDMKGLLCYLGEKVCQGFMCLWCNDKGKAFYSLESVQQHMTDKGHCKMLHEGEAVLEYSPYYDYSSSYIDYDDIKDTEEVTIPILDDSDYQLVLPSGATIGHRSLMRYYRQNFDPNKQVVPLQKRVHRVIAQYRALGWTGSDKIAAVKKAKDIKFMHNLQNKHRMKLGIKANDLSIKRPQVNF